MENRSRREHRFVNKKILFLQVVACKLILNKEDRFNNALFERPKDTTSSDFYSREWEKGTENERHLEMEMLPTTAPRHSA